MSGAGLQGDAESEIIEILDVDGDAFGDRGRSTTVHDTGGPRWIGPAAAVVLALLIGYGIATSATSGGPPKAEPAPSTTARAPTTTLPAPTTTVAPEPPVPYYSADLPRDYAIRVADLVRQGGTQDGDYELWATDGATATSGSWFSIASSPGGGVYAEDAYRRTTADGTIAISHTPTGHTIAQFAKHDTDIVVTSFGWTDDALVQLAGSITAGFRGVQISDPTLVAGHQLMTTVPPEVALRGHSVEHVYYASRTDPDGGVLITVSPRPASARGGSTFDRDVAERFLLDQPQQFAVDGHLAVVGTLVGQHADGLSLATWIAGDHVVSVLGKVSVTDMIAIAGTVHRVRGADWEGMKFQASKNNFGDPDTLGQENTPVQVASGTDADSVEWTIKVAVNTFDHFNKINWIWDNNGTVTTGAATPQINTAVDDRRSYVFADLPVPAADGSVLRVDRAGLDSVVVPLVGIDPATARTFAAYAFSEAVPYTAQIVGPDGSVLADWSSTV